MVALRTSMPRFDAVWFSTISDVRALIMLLFVYRYVRPRIVAELFSGSEPFTMLTSCTPLSTAAVAAFSLACMPPVATPD